MSVVTHEPEGEEPAFEKKPKNTRRTFLISAGVGVLAVGVGGKVGWEYLRKNVSAIAETRAPSASVPDAPFVWFTVNADNTIIFHVPKIEIGQGIHTALAQIAADELEADWERFRVVQADTEYGFASGTQNTFGSISVAALYAPLREAAATVRETLRVEAAKRLNTSVENIIAKNGQMILRSDESKRLAYGDLVAGKQGEWALAKAAQLKSASDFTLIGKSVKRVDLRDKVTGRAVYGLDARLPNMLYGAVVRPPRYGATLKSAKAGEAATMQGVVKVVIENGFAGVVAERRSVARAAVARIQCEWEGGVTESQAAFDKLTTVTNDKSNAVAIQENGTVQEHRQDNDVIAQYRTSIAAHAHLEPQAALADVQTDGKTIQSVTMIASTQMPDIMRTMISRALGVEKEKIIVKPTYAGGAFGRRGAHDVGVEAAMLSRAVGKPVHVGWTREEEMRYGYYRPPTHHVLRGRVDAAGKMEMMEHEIASGDVLLAFASFFGNAFVEGIADAFGVDPGAMTGALSEYDIQHYRVLSHRVKLPFLTASWRGLGLLPNVFARESFIDELAFAAKKDPMQFRFEHLPDTELGKRYKQALKRVQEMSGWNTTPEPGRARGVAFCLHAKTVAAQVAEVSVKDGRLKVHRVWAAVDPGMAVNPNGAVAQIQGAIVMGLSSVFYEKITFNNGIAEAKNFDGYPLLTLPETPDIVVELLTSSDVPHGMGEVGIGPIAAAVGNALFALTGKRMRELPFALETLA